MTAADPSRPRVVILTPFFRPIVGGVESTAERLARYFTASGLGVTILTKRLTHDLADHDAIDGVPIERIGPYGPRAPMAKWRMLPAVTSWLVTRREDYDVVCSIDCRGVGLGALAARGWSGRPVVVQPQTTGVLASDGTTAGFSAAVKQLLGGIYVRADAIACIARTIEREALSRRAPRERVHYLPNAIDMTRFRPPTTDERVRARERFKIPEASVVAVFVGRLSREKGVAELLEAWRLLQPIPNAHLIVAGPDMTGHAWDLGSDARAFATARGLDASVHFVGPTTDVPGLMHAADLAVQPSHFEALGLSAIEALACGVPVVASAVGGLLDFVVDGVNGRTCPPRDAAALAECIRSLIVDADFRRRTSARARASVATEYDERVVFERFAGLVRRLAQRRDR